MNLPSGTVNFLSVLCVLIFALLKGGVREKIAIGAYFIISVLAIAIFDILVINIKFELLFVCDASCLAAFIALAHKYKRNWPAWASAFQLNAVVWDILMIYDKSAYTWGTTTILHVSSYAVLLAIIVGVINNIGPQFNQRLSH
jgi:hypothetical protein